MKKGCFPIVVIASCIWAWPTCGQELIFQDGFESANTLAWSSRSGESLLPAEVFRMSDLDLRDPHVFINLGIPFGCRDFTDQDLPLLPGTAFNGQLQTAITTDGDADNLLDSSFLLQFRPYDSVAVDFRLDLANGLCSAPMIGTSCAPDPAVVPQTVTYDFLAAGTCLEPLAGTTHGPYTPEIATPLVPCFVSAARDVAFVLNGLSLPLKDVQLAATPSGAPPTTMADGLLRGFLTQALADAILLPADLPIVGGQPLSILLPGGAGNCAAHDDRETHESELGWWFYLNFPTARVIWTGL